MATPTSTTSRKTKKITSADLADPKNKADWYGKMATQKQKEYQTAADKQNARSARESRMTGQPLRGTNTVTPKQKAYLKKVKSGRPG